MCVKWGDLFSETFYVSNGARQSGIFSPPLVNVYMDDLSKQLSSINTGSSIGGHFTNHLGYADDLCLMTLTPRGMQNLLVACMGYNMILFTTKGKLSA